LSKTTVFGYRLDSNWREELKPKSFPKNMFIKEAKYPLPYKEAYQKSKFTELIQTYAEVLKLGYLPSDYSIGHYD
jgi:hypothetical protein